MKKVLQISKYYYPFLGGTEQVARNISIALSKLQNVEQKVICFNEDVSDEEHTYKKGQTIYDKVDGVDIIRCGYQLKISSQALSISYKKELDKLMNDFNPDLVILHYPNPYVTHYLLKHKNKKFKLWVYWHLDITKQKVLKHIFYMQNKKLIERADKILGATPKHLEESEFSEYFNGKKQILPYTIDEKNLLITNKEIQMSKQIRSNVAGNKIAFFIGRHVPYKGLKYLIESAQKLKDEKIVFLIAGTGELTSELMNLAENNKNVIFLGKISDSERRAYFKACDVFCFPSITRNEGFGLALAEGMYFGKPAITFTIPGSGVNFVNLDKITGIECPNRDVNAYASAVNKLCKDDELRLKYGKAAKKRVIENFTLEKFEDNIKRLISEI